MDGKDAQLVATVPGIELHIDSVDELDSDYIPGENTIAGRVIKVGCFPPTLLV